MNYILLREETKEFRIHKIPVKAKVRIECAPEIESIEDSFDFDDEATNKAYLDRFLNGELEAIVLKVTATAEGCEGIESLGMCHIRTDHRDNDTIETVESHDMVNNAIGELRRDILERANQLVKFAGSTA